MHPIVLIALVLLAVQIGAIVYAVRSGVFRR
jgi:hypothetical protein